MLNRHRRSLQTETERVRAEHPPYQSIRSGIAPVLIAVIALGTAATPAATPSSGGLIGKPAPEFVLPAVVGPNVRLSEFRGQPVMISFWSSRCSVCTAHLTAMDRYYATYRSSGLVVLGVSVDDDQQRASDYARSHATSFPLLLDKTKGVSRAFDIERLPTTV